MKIGPGKPSFVPFVIELESREELLDLQVIFNAYLTPQNESMQVRRYNIANNLRRALNNHDNRESSYG